MEKICFYGRVLGERVKMKYLVTLLFSSLKLCIIYLEISSKMDFQL